MFFNASNIDNNSIYSFSLYKELLAQAKGFKDIAILEGHAASVDALAVLPDGRIVSGSHDTTLRIWDSEERLLFLEYLQEIACRQLRIGRLLLYKATSIDDKSSLFLELPLEIKEKIVTHVYENALLTNEQQRLILNYAEGKIAPVADKLSFFRATKCDRIRKQINQNEIETASYATAL